jgi:hypothetical protein|tara:strand:- start:393 stop:521 length:129 start_codon:yes stop_codon:yes gene_type:complete
MENTKNNTEYWDKPYPRYIEVPESYWTSTPDCIIWDNGDKNE